LKPERWGSPLVQEKYQEEKACDKRHPYVDDDDDDNNNNNNSNNKLQETQQTYYLDCTTLCDIHKISQNI